MTFFLSKHHGLGNDFLVHLTHDAEAAADRNAWAARGRDWCRRSRGVGADGLIVGLRGQPGTDLVMTLVNADGSIAEMSGNGIRCLAQAESIRRGTPEAELVIQTDGGSRLVSLRPDPGGDASLAVASVDMGPVGPGPRPDGHPSIPDQEIERMGVSRLALDPVKAATFDVGNPHLVLLVEDPEAVDVAVAGRYHEGVYSNGINVHFVAQTRNEADAITMRVWERGAGLTEACGTGAVAVARAAHDWGLVGERVTVHMSGGDVEVDVGDTMTLHGTTTFIADVEIWS